MFKRAQDPMMTTCLDHLQVRARFKHTEDFYSSLAGCVCEIKLKNVKEQLHIPFLGCHLPSGNDHDRINVIPKISQNTFILHQTYYLMSEKLHLRLGNGFPPW